MPVTSTPATPVPDAGIYTLSEKDEEHEHNQRFTAGADFQGPVKVRCGVLGMCWFIYRVSLILSL